jgi:beta-glucosidase
VELIPSQYLRPLRGDPTESGLTGSYFGASESEAEPAFRRVDPVINFIWKDETPVTGGIAEAFAVRWEGSLRAPVTGTYHLGVNGFSAYRLFLDDELIVSYRGIHHPILHTREVALESGRFYRIRLEYQNRGSDPQVQLLWSVPGSDGENRALEIARKSDVVVFAGGLSPRVEGEEMPVKVEGFLGGDRTDLRLPPSQDNLLKKLHQLGKPIVLVLFNGSSLSLAWADQNVPAILTAWYPGQAGGEAIADVLFGDYNPAGRLPLTFYRSVEDLPTFDNYNMEGRTYRYFRGQPVYPFGHGLSYSKFEYNNLEIEPVLSSGSQDVRVGVEIANTGTRAGEEVVQLYVTDREATVPVPIRSLQGFQRVRLEAGAHRQVEFLLTPRQLSVFTDSGQRVVEPGEFLISVGGKQPGFSGNADAATTAALSGVLTVEGVSPVRVQ